MRTFTSKSEKKGHDFTMTPSWVHPWLGHDDPTEKRIGGSSFHSLLARGTCLWNKPEAAASVWPSRACHLSLETAPMMPVLSQKNDESLKMEVSIGFHRNVLHGTPKSSPKKRAFPYRPPIYTYFLGYHGNPHMFQPQKMRFRSMAWPWPSRCPAPAVAFPKGSWKGSCGMRHCCGRSHLPLWDWGMTK